MKLSAVFKITLKSTDKKNLQKDYCRFKPEIISGFNINSINCSLCCQSYLKFLVLLLFRFTLVSHYIKNNSTYNNGTLYNFLDISIYTEEYKSALYYTEDHRTDNCSPIVPIPPISRDVPPITADAIASSSNIVPIFACPELIRAERTIAARPESIPAYV